MVFWLFELVAVRMKTSVILHVDTHKHTIDHENTEACLLLLFHVFSMTKVHFGDATTLKHKVGLIQYFPVCQ